MAGVVCAPPAHASPTTYEFTGLGDGHSWSDQMNWSPQGIPHSLDSIVVGTPAHPVAHLDEALTTTLAGITIGSGGSIEGQPLLAATVSLSGGTVYNEITALNLLQTSGPVSLLQSKDVSDPHAGKLIVADQAIIGGDLRTIRGTIVNQGTMTATSNATLNGNFGSNAKGTFVNEGTVTATPGAILTLQNFDIEDPGSLGGGPPGVSGGTVEVNGSDLHLTTTAKIDDHVILDNGTVATADGNVSLHSGATLSIDGSTSTTLAGTPNFTGTGTFDWLNGTITGEVTLSAGVTMKVQSAGAHKLNAAAGSPFTVSPGAFVTQRGASLALGIHTTVVNQGAWRVRDASSSITGLSCCVPGSTAIFDNSGTVEVEAGLTLTLGTPGIDYLQRPAGALLPDGAAGGRVVMLGSDSELTGGRVGLELVLAGNSAVEVTGTVNIDNGAVVRQTESADVTATGAATFGGEGRYRWSDGTITGQVVFGPSVTLAIDDPDAPGANKALLPGPTTGGLLDVRGPSTIATTLPVLVTSTSSKVSSIRNRGVMAWTKGTVDFTGVPGTFTNQGVLRVAPGAEAPATVRLDGSLLNKGKVELTRRGTLMLSGAFTQTANGTTHLTVAGKTAAKRDRITAGGALTLDGTLALTRRRGTGVTGYTMLAGSSRTGRFAQVTGLGRFPSGYHVGYSATGVKLLA